MLKVTYCSRLGFVPITLCILFLVLTGCGGGEPNDEYEYANGEQAYEESGLDDDDLSANRNGQYYYLFDRRQAGPAPVTMDSVFCFDQADMFFF